jgi:hypothetical protein
MRQVASYPSSGEKQSHTAHVSTSTRVYYPHLPYFGEAAKIVRSCPSFGPDHVQVELPSGNQVVLPLWMLDEEACKGMLICEQPVIAIEALLTLRSLLDSQPLLVGQDSTTSGPSSLPGGQVESPKATAVPVRRTKNRTSGGDPTALS